MEIQPNFPTELHSLCMATGDVEFAILLERISEPAIITTTLTEKPTSTLYARIFYPVPGPFIVTETVTKTIFKGSIRTMQPPNVQNITGSIGTTGTMKAVKMLVATIVQTATDTLYGVSSVASTEAVPDSTCPWPEYADYTADSTAISPEPCGE